MRRQRNLLGPQGMGGMVSLWGASSLIKSVQRGTLTLAANTISNTATITSVDTTNSMLVFGQNNTNYSNLEWRYQMGRLALTNATTVTLSRTATGLVGDLIGCTYEVIEFLPGILKSIQRGTVTQSGALTVNATITEVNTSNATCTYLGLTGDSNFYAGYTQQITLALLNATTVQVAMYWSGGGVSETIGYQVAEFY